MTLTIDAFNKLRSREKWNRYKTIGKGKWECPGCGATMDGPRRASPFSGCSINCSKCDYELTRRTGGGQSDPFNWKLVPKRVRIKNLRREEVDIRYLTKTIAGEGCLVYLRREDVAKYICLLAEGEETDVHDRLIEAAGHLLKVGEPHASRK